MRVDTSMAHCHNLSYTMLNSTYLHTPGVGPATELDLWRQGAHTWDHFLENAATLHIPKRFQCKLQSRVEESVAMLDAARVDYFAQALPKREHWRSASHFNDKLGYLDIETDGGNDADSVTLIGISDGFDTKFYIKGQNLAQFAYDCQEFDGFVTFFGGGFDIPFLVRRFPVLRRVFDDRFHIDLCPLLKRLGHRGGLKKIERELKITRVPEAEGLDGMDAVRLWYAYIRGGRGADNALEQLLAYNREDVENMKILLNYALPKMRDASGWVDPMSLEQLAHVP